MHGAGSESKAEPNLIPLLDVVFQLIMFFLITVNLVRTDKFKEKVALPVAQNALPLEETEVPPVVLQINADGRLLAPNAGDEPGKEGDAEIPSMDKLRSYLRRTKEQYDREARERGKKEPKVMVVLRADTHTPFRDVWEVLSTCNEAGFREWQLRVQQLMRIRQKG
jgi:biopolymer transport protein ExbD